MFPFHTIRVDIFFSRTCGTAYVLKKKKKKEDKTSATIKKIKFS